ncbi:glycoside hydrolase family 3 N-terminal domain-containing protein [Bifidobacterium miconisargentati]|uniref:glycoside hydrolase family 3 N-terminal domain-containing protein n=1 Tax=Bifidobacterium miconisargentati TaxID=2834437 RepID=UPI001BDC1DF7|nr:glycoside hydrolase family 3 N-terminal domain-containing protein [Bifidobacterium miconisargentati]MBW3090094.1 glycoside hydrolase family 3 C-terminal domain-containing protein [Bifidobacterium miconisargentati]
MIDINWSDVINVLRSVTPHLIAVGIVLLLALIVTVAVNRRTVQQVAVRKLVHSQAWLVAFVAFLVAVSMMLFGPLSTLLTSATAEKHVLSSTTEAQAKKLGVEVQREAVTLLKNDDSNLPLSNKKVNVFGWSSTNPVYGGTGAGALSDTYPTVSLLDGFKQAGLETNTELSDMYVKYRADRPSVNMWIQDWTQPEVPAAQYSDEMISNAKAFSDEAVIVLARVGGEHADLPTEMRPNGKTGLSDSAEYERTHNWSKKPTGIKYEDNSTEYPDYQEGQHLLQLSQTEKDLVDLVTKNFDKVTVIYNGANAFQFDFLKDHPQIKSVVWCPPAGQTGFVALGEIMAGKVNPSGKSADTFVTDLTKSPTWNNFGDFTYDNMDEFQIPADDTFMATARPTFTRYVEGIYVGYKFYETAGEEGLIDYDNEVAFPFGHGLSYTTFKQDMGNVHVTDDGKVTFDVTVTNTGDVAGKDVVEVYYNPPYTNGGIEKSSVNLIAFDKTKKLAPGESEKLTMTFNEEDMASYDYKNAKAYVLESGDYGISIRSDAHTVIEEQTVNVPKTITYDQSDPRSTDKTAATNQFDDAEGDVTYLSRADHFANYDKATAAPASMSMPEADKAKFVNNGNYDPADHDNADDAMPTTGADNGIKLADLYGADYDDERWDQLLDELTVDDMENLIAMGGYGTQAIDKIGKIFMFDLDGSAALNNNFTGVGSIGFSSAVAFACTWNTDLADRFGAMIGDMSHDMDSSGWYAPSMNIHRSAFSGRNYEYFSEDGLLSGVMAAHEIAAAKDKGVYSFMKHFALNDQETNRWSMLCTWSNEQAIREIYLKPFELSVKDGGAQAVMSAYNYIGITYAGAYSPLLNTVLRDEWGFHGMVLTDYFGGFGYQNSDQIIRNGGDVMLATTNITNHVSDKSATSVIAMRQAAKNILYTTANSYHYANGDPKSQTPVWITITIVMDAVCGLLIAGLEVLAIRRYLGRRKAIVTVESSDEQ